MRADRGDRVGDVDRLQRVAGTEGPAADRGDLTTRTNGNALQRIAVVIRRFIGRKQHFAPVFSQQSTYLVHASRALCQITETVDQIQWRKLEKEVKACEIQGDALLAEFHEQLYESFMTMAVRTDMHALAMDLDDFLDHINDSAKSVLLYMPRRIDSHIRDLAQYISAEADAIRDELLAKGITILDTREGTKFTINQ